MCYLVHISASCVSREIYFLKLIHRSKLIIILSFTEKILVSQMIQIPSIMSNDESNNPISSLNNEIIDRRHMLALGIVDSDEEFNYGEEQMIMQIQNSPLEKIANNIQLKTPQSILKAKESQKGFDNYQRFKILEKNFVVQSDEDQDEYFQQKKPSQKARNPSQNIFFTQILQSKVFHRDVIQVAKTEACLKDSMTTYNPILDSNSQTDPHLTKQLTVKQFCLPYTADVFFLMGGEWLPEKICVKNTQLRFSDFAMEVQGISKIKIFREEQHQKLLKIKLTINGHNYLIGVSDSEERANMAQFKLFANIIKSKLEINCKVPKRGDFNGKLLKKSQYLARWDARHINVENSQLSSYKEGKCTFKIKKGSIKELWTRFDFIQNFLIIKISHSLKKTEFGIPVTNFTQIFSKNWLLTFYRLLKAN